MRKILVLRGGALGDFIVTLPALAALRTAWPAAQIELAGNATAARLGQTAGLLDAGHSQHEARWAALYRPEQLPPAFATWLASFDLLINYWPDPERELCRHFPLHPGQRFLTTPALPTSAPAAAHYAAPLAQLGLPSGEVRYPLASRDPTAVSSQLIALHPGSGSPRKNWPLARWLALARWLREEQQATLLIISGEADAPGPWSEIGPVARQLPLNELVAQLTHCRLFLGHDSGVSHLAAACSIPCVLLFGPTDSNCWAPPGSHVTVVRGDSATMTSISTASVQAAVAAALRTAA